MQDNPEHSELATPLPITEIKTYEPSVYDQYEQQLKDIVPMRRIQSDYPLISSFEHQDKYSQIPRRNQLDLLTPAEMVIHQAIQAVEGSGAHPLLTDAVILLMQAKEKVADYVDLENKAIT